MRRTSGETLITGGPKNGGRPKEPVAVSLNTTFRDCFLRYFCDRFFAAEGCSFSGIYFNYFGLFTDSLFAECNFRDIHRVTMSFGSSGICPRSWPGVFVRGAVLYKCTIELTELPTSLPEEVRKLSHTLASACVFSISAGALTNCTVYSEYRGPILALWKYGGYYSYSGRRINNELFFKDNIFLCGSKTISSPTVVIEGRKQHCVFADNTFWALSSLKLTITEGTTGSLVFNGNSCIVSENIVFDNGTLLDGAVVSPLGFSHKMEQEATDNLFDCGSLTNKAVRLKQSVIFAEVADQAVAPGANIYIECEELYVKGIDVKHLVKADFDAGRVDEGYSFPGKFGACLPHIMVCAVSRK
ncbi:MAG: hypothetical protein U5N86_14035 [Planctomycetota bacterium]|nr:hypothetical protein [Planctomycetota bacterium]